MASVKGPSANRADRPRGRGMPLGVVAVVCGAAVVAVLSLEARRRKNFARMQRLERDSSKQLAARMHFDSHTIPTSIPPTSDKAMDYIVMGYAHPTWTLHEAQHRMRRAGAYRRMRSIFDIDVRSIGRLLRQLFPHEKVQIKFLSGGYSSVLFHVVRALLTAPQAVPAEITCRDVNGVPQARSGE